ncbi:MAG: UDP-N-acetylmuramoyl-L-alanine--D-glutamate ligase, partial [Angustibacter sp.]
LQRGARVTVVDDRHTPTIADRAEILRIMGATVEISASATQRLPEQGLDLVLCSPGWRPDQPLLRAAAARGLPIWGDIDLAWRMRPASGPRWITVTGTNGKTSTVRLVTAMLAAAGLRVEAVGNIGTPVLDALANPDLPDVLVVELSSFQLHWASQDPRHCVSPLASAVLNVAPDHVDWHGDFAQYAAAKGKIYQQTQEICLYNVEDPQTERLLREAEVVEGARAVGFTLGIPAVGMVGVVDDVLADRAFIDQRQTNAAELATLADVQGAAGVLAPHQVANALAAAALARAAGAPALAIRAGIRGFTPDPHRLSEVAVLASVRFVDDSKATNPPAAAAALSAFDHIVWLAGGLL